MSTHVYQKYNKGNGVKSDQQSAQWMVSLHYDIAEG